MGIEEKEIQTEGIDSLFNNKITENFLNLEKGRDRRLRRITEYQTSGPEKKHPQTNHNQYIEQGKNTEGCKREKTSHIQRQTH
jgi:hypothetical protein